MDGKEQSGIAVDWINIEEVKFSVNPEFSEGSGPVELGLLIGVETDISEDGKALTVDLTLKANFSEDIIPPMDLSISLKGFFRLENEEKKNFFGEFAKVNAPAIMYPYAREVISNLTVKSRLPTLLLPIINFKAAQESQAKEKTKQNKLPSKKPSKKKLT